MEVNFHAEPMAPFLNTTKAAPEIKALASRVYLMQVLQIDRNTLDNIPEGLIVFTPQGLLIHSMNGGTGTFFIAGLAAAGILSRKAEQEVLSKQLKDLERNLAKSQSSIDELELRISENRQIVGEIDTKLQGQNKEVLGVMAELQSARQTAENKQELTQQARHQVQARGGAAGRQALPARRALHGRRQLPLRDDRLGRLCRLRPEPLPDDHGLPGARRRAALRQGGAGGHGGGAVSAEADVGCASEPPRSPVGWRGLGAGVAV